MRLARHAHSRRARATVVSFGRVSLSLSRFLASPFRRGSHLAATEQQIAASECHNIAQVIFLLQLLLLASSSSRSVGRSVGRPANRLQQHRRADRMNALEHQIKGRKDDSSILRSERCCPSRLQMMSRATDNYAKWNGARSSPGALLLRLPLPLRLPLGLLLARLRRSSLR